MFKIKGQQCIRCNTNFSSHTLFDGCPVCRKSGKLSNVSVIYEDIAPRPIEDLLSANDQSMWRYRAFLGVSDGEVSLGEGLTPLLRCSHLGEKFGLSRMFLKNEGQNPTGSYKDRLSSMAVTRAKTESAIGIATSSTGNHGASTAAYAAKAGLPCLIFTVASMPESMKLQMQALGSMLVATDDYRDRWRLLRYCVEQAGWYSTGNFSNPPIGSSPYGIEGYKTIAYEICESLNWQPPDVVVMPVAYGDGIRGTSKGFRDLVALGMIERVPRMIAAETGGSLTEALAKNLDLPPEVSINPSVALSIHTPVSTYQALKTIQDTGGTAVRVGERQVLEAQRDLGACEGLFVEPASAATVAAIKQLSREDRISKDEIVVGILTSTGLKYSRGVREFYPEVPVVTPDISDLQRVLKRDYDYDLSV